MMNVVDLGDMDYDGSQLRHAFAYEKCKALGPTISFFIGAADVKEHLVDLEDALADDFIKSERMAHFIIEIPGVGIQEAVVWQRLFIHMIAKVIVDTVDGIAVDVDGDDVLVEDQKLSVSIATLSRFSALIHAGINIRVGEGCPVDAIGLSDFDGFYNFLSEHEWIDSMARTFAAEYDSIVNATYKVVEAH